jgi:hypothetical protein
MDRLSLFCLAASDKIDPGSIGIDPVTDANAAVGGALNAVYTGAGMLCVVIIVIAGYFYTASWGDPATTKRAREAVIGAVIGLIAIMMAFVITQFILGRF